MDQREEGSWRERNDAFRRKVLQDVSRFLFREVRLNFFSCPGRSRLSLLPMIKEEVEKNSQSMRSEKIILSFASEKHKGTR